MELVTKISIGSINKIRKGFKAVTERKHVMRVVGIARSAELKVNENMADSKKFVGEFRAWNSEGEEFSSPVMYIPEPAQSLLASAVEVDGHNGIQFGFDFFIVPNENAPIGYNYEIKHLMESKPSDALSALISHVGAPKLAAPVAAQAQADPGEETKSQSKRKH